MVPFFKKEMILLGIFKRKAYLIFAAASKDCNSGLNSHKKNLPL
jgi:hypothetical protein